MAPESNDRALLLRYVRLCVCLSINIHIAFISIQSIVWCLVWFGLYLTRKKHFLRWPPFDVDRVTLDEPRGRGVPLTQLKTGTERQFRD